MGLVLVIDTGSQKIHVCVIELFEATVIKRVPDVLHELVIEIEVMEHAQAHTKRLTRFKEVADIRAAIAAAGRTVTAWRKRAVIGEVCHK